MKKFIAVLLVAVMVIGNSMVVFGDAGNRTGLNTTVGTNQVEIGVTGTYSITEDAVYSVDVSWGELRFKCEQRGSWNATNHQHNIDRTTWTWDENSNFITVKNHSNKKIAATLDFRDGLAGVNPYFLGESAKKDNYSGIKQKNRLELNQSGNQPTTDTTYLHLYGHLTSVPGTTTPTFGKIIVEITANG